MSPGNVERGRTEGSNVEIMLLIFINHDINANKKVITNRNSKLKPWLTRLIKAKVTRDKIPTDVKYSKTRDDINIKTINEIKMTHWHSKTKTTTAMKRLWWPKRSRGGVEVWGWSGWSLVSKCNHHLLHWLSTRNCRFPVTVDRVIRPGLALNFYQLSIPKSVRCNSNTNPENVWSNERVQEAEVNWKQWSLSSDSHRNEATFATIRHRKMEVIFQIIRHLSGVTLLTLSDNGKVLLAFINSPVAGLLTNAKIQRLGKLLALPVMSLKDVSLSGAKDDCSTPCGASESPNLTDLLIYTFSRPQRQFFPTTVQYHHARQ